MSVIGAAWDAVMFCQFHDVAGGVGIRRVHQEAEASLTAQVHALEKLIERLPKAEAKPAPAKEIAVITETAEGFLMENPVPEMLLTTYLAVLSASCMGLIVSALSNNADRAMTVSPFLLVIQMVFAGIIFKLDGAVKAISNLTVSRWAISALGISADLEKMYEPVEEQNELIANLTGETVAVDKSLELFERADGNMLECWLVMLGFCLVCCVISAVVLRRVAKDSR